MTTRIGFNPDARKAHEESAQSKQMYEGDDPFQVDKWYPVCQQYTFETKSIALTLPQVQAIKFMCHYFKLFKEHELEKGEQKGKGITLNYNQSSLLESFNNSDDDIKDDDNNNESLSYSWGESFNWKALDAESSLKYINPLIELENNINAIMDELKCDQGIFIRLNTRSPKDASIPSAKTYQC